MDLSKGNVLRWLPADVRGLIKELVSDRHAPTPAARAVSDHVAANLQVLVGARAWNGETPIFWMTPLTNRLGLDGYYVGPEQAMGFNPWVDSDLVLLSDHAHVGLRTWYSIDLWRMMRRNEDARLHYALQRHYEGAVGRIVTSI